MVLNIDGPLQIAAKPKSCCIYRKKVDLKVEKDKKELLKNSEEGHLTVGLEPQTALCETYASGKPGSKKIHLD